jgi:hypothetical protein
MRTISGNKTYLLMGIGMVAIAAHRFGVLPHFGVPSGDWIIYEFALAGVMVIRSALGRIERAILSKN